MMDVMDEFEELNWFEKGVYMAIFFVFFIIVELPLTIAEKVCDL